MIAFLPHAGFMSEVSRAIAIAGALRDRGVPVVFGCRGGPYAHLIEEAGFACTKLAPRMDGGRAASFLDAVLSMGKSNEPFYGDDELDAAVDAEVAFLRETGARIAVTGFTLTAYISTRLAGVPLATDHGGICVPPLIAHGIGPLPVNPPHPGMKRMPAWLQRLIGKLAPALLRAPVAQLNRHAVKRGVEPLPNLLSLMCGELTLVTELPEMLGLPASTLEQWRPRWPYRARSGTSFRWTGPLYAKLNMPIPSDVESFLQGSEPVVYLAPTSVHPEFLRALITQAKATGAKLLVSATIHDVADLADSRTLIGGILPNHLVMPRVAAAVIMGGQGSVQTALASGLPFVGLPHHGEQELNVAVAERRGSAVRMSPAE